MCTVSFIKLKEKYIFSSNRDENSMRPLAIAPMKVEHEGYSLYYPIDPVANGSWFCVKSDGSVLILLNGATQKHEVQAYYRKSRGLVLLDIIAAREPLMEWENIVLENIAPFTIIAFSGGTLVQLLWDGSQKQKKFLDSTKAYIWSSVTLYTQDIIKKREKWFHDFLVEKQFHPTDSELLAFHTQTQSHDSENGLLINRNTEMLTKNLTQCVLTEHDFTLTHLDLIRHEKSELKDTIVVAQTKSLGVLVG